MDDGLRFFDILSVLYRHEVEFVIVGGVAAILEGAPIATFDVDVVFRRSPENIPRLLSALGDLNAFYKDPAGRRIVPDASKLETFKFNLMITDHGKLDLLYSIGDGLIYEDLLDRSHEYELEGMRFRALSLEAIIEAKVTANRPKDRAVLPILHRTLELKKSADGA